MALTNKPEGVVPSDKAVEMFGNIVADAYKRLGAIAESADYSTPSRRSQITKQIDALVAQMDDTLKAWVKVQVPTFYEQGMFAGAKTLFEKNAEAEIKTSLAHFHEEAITALANDTYQNIAQGMQGLTRAGQRIVSMGARQSMVEQIATGKITGETRKDITNNIKDLLAKEGITGLTDKAGRSWSLDRYGEMLARTKLTQSHNTGTINRMAESGYDLVIVSRHSGSCDLCAPYEGQVLSITGKGGAFMSLDDAIANGLFHPNCRHVITPYHNSFLSDSVIWDIESQQYIPFADYLSIPTPVSAPNYKEMIVYRAEDSTRGGAVLGEGKYVAFNKENVTQYGTNIKEYVLDPKAKMLDLSDPNSVDRLQDEMLRKYGDRVGELVDKYSDSGMAKAFAEYVYKVKGYDGIIGDDKAFGTVIFNTAMLKPRINETMVDVLGKQVAMTQDEVQHMASSGIKFDIANKRNVGGDYNYLSNQLSIKKSVLKNEQMFPATFWHEFGHSIDYYNKFNPTRNLTEVLRVSAGEEFKNILKDNEVTQILINRLSKEKIGGTLSEDDLKKVLSFQTVTTGENEKAKIPFKLLQYLKSAPEVFAESYGQYKTDSEAFRKYAPTLAKYFDSVFDKRKELMQ